MNDAGNVSSVVKSRLCCACGACAAVCPHGSVTIEEGRHYNWAKVDENTCVRCGLCLQVCPGRDARRTSITSPGPSVPPQDCMLAWSNDEACRLEGSSGGLVTGLARWLLDTGACDAAILVAADENRPLYTRTVVAASADQVSPARGSRYLPASACQGLKYVADNPGRYVFVGKGCEVSALRKAQRVMPVLKERVVLAIGLFCAQTPDRTRTGEFLRRHNVVPDEVTDLQFRGGIWPGDFIASDKARVLVKVPYRVAWDFLAGGTCSLGCFLCDDGRAWNADISVGDPWSLSQSDVAGEGATFTITRTASGRDALVSAEKAGAITVIHAPREVVRYSEEMLARRSAAVQSRRYTYSVCFEFPGALSQCLRARAAGIRTILKQRLNSDYY